MGIPTENVLIRNITCPAGGRGGFAIGSEMSGGMRNITYRDSVLDGERGINIKPSLGRGGYMQDVTFENIRTRAVGFHLGGDGERLMPGNNYVPLVANFAFINVGSVADNVFAVCKSMNQSKCFNATVNGQTGAWPDALPPQTFACKTTAKTLFGDVTLPWGVCIPHNAPVNLRADYPNYGVATGAYSTLAECTKACDRMMDEVRRKE